jgi:hypothetical protein
MSYPTLRSIRAAVAATAGIAGLMACSDSTPPNGNATNNRVTTAVVGRYAVVAVDSKPLPGFVSASVNSPTFGYDTAWMQADTLSLRDDSVAVEMGVFSYKRAGAGPTTPIVGVEADSVRGRFSVTDGRLIVRTWMDVDDTVEVLDGGAHLRRAVIVWNFRPTRIKPVLTYQRMQ